MTHLFQGEKKSAARYLFLLTFKIYHVIVYVMQLDVMHF